MKDLTRETVDVANGRCIIARLSAADTINRDDKVSIFALTAKQRSNVRQICMCAFYGTSHALGNGITPRGNFYGFSCDWCHEHIERGEIKIFLPKLTIIAVTKDDPEGLVRMLRRAADWSARKEDVHIFFIFENNGQCSLMFEGVEIEACGTISTRKAMADLLAVAGVLSAADAFILPSLQNNLPNIAIKAQACGCPIIGFDSGGLGEVVENGITGWLAPNRAKPELGRLLAVYTLGSFRERTKIADACRARTLRLFDPEKDAADLIKYNHQIFL